MCARERRREARAKFCGVSFRRFLENAGRHVISGVFDENAGRCTPESAVFFVVSSLHDEQETNVMEIFLKQQHYVIFLFQ